MKVITPNKRFAHSQIYSRLSIVGRFSRVQFAEKNES